MGEIKYRYNVINVDSVSTFARVTGRYSNECRDVYLAVLHGEDCAVKSEFDNMERIISAMDVSRNIIYKKIEKLPVLNNREDMEYYIKCYDNWVNSGKSGLDIKSSIDNHEVSKRLGMALCRALDDYSSKKPGVSESIKRNFSIKLMYWADTVFADDLKIWKEDSRIKVTVSNVEKEAEAYFCYMLTRIGADVIIHSGENVKLPDIINKNAKVIDAKYVKQEPTAQQKTVTQTKPVGKYETVKAAKRPVERKAEPVNIRHENRETNSGEKSFEELAMLAKSVVMIGIHDEKGEIVGSGSGIMIGRQGFILTNNHVVRNGAFFSVRIEEDENAYPTDEIIKYNAEVDMAIIRIEKELMPIPVYTGDKKLVRGQRVVAIGSPLGLFNSVSDGIISGFRNVNGVDMIQFTAPTSHGSSGGAVLNMYGEVIGMSTAGIDSGQNLNLAVKYEDINPFIRGFI